MPPEARSSPGPEWFRLVVWDALLAGACPLLPVPVVDDLAQASVRRRLVARLAERAGVALSGPQVRRLAGERRGLSILGLAGKAVLYPFRKLLKKVLYVLAVKEGIDTFSAVFHRGYLLAVATQRGALGSGGPAGEHEVERVARAVEGTLAAVDTRPLGRIVRAVFRTSRDLLGETLRWIARRAGRSGEVLAAGEDAATLAAASPAAESLVERLVAVLWGEEDYRRRLESEVAARLAALE